jgi:transcriptional regulator with XRE-family HTH domain
MDFHEKLRLISDERGINQAKLRRMLSKKVAGATISNWFNGLYMPDLDVAYNVAQIFKVPIEYLADPAIGEDQILRHLRGDDGMEPAKRTVFQLADSYTWQGVLDRLMGVGGGSGRSVSSAGG